MISYSINKVILIGNLGKDPEISVTSHGSRMARLSLATNNIWYDKLTKERHEKTEWHRIVIFGEPLINYSEKYLKRGSKVYLQGRLETRKWNDQSGQERYTTEVLLNWLFRRVMYT